ANAQEEVACVAARVERALAAGIAPSAIAVIVTDEKRYSALLRGAFRRLARRDTEGKATSVASNFAIPLRFAETPLGVWLDLLVTQLLAAAQLTRDGGEPAEAVDHGRPSAAALDFLMHPLTLSWLAPDQQSFSSALCQALRIAERGSLDE